MPPETPKLIFHSHSDQSGELHIKFKPLTVNRFGPITSYRIVVINETEASPFDEKSLHHWDEARERGLRYWIAAEIDPAWFDHHDEFIVGDGRIYGGYLNYGPLDEKDDFHVTAGTVSTWRNITKGETLLLSGFMYI